MAWMWGLTFLSGGRFLMQFSGTTEKNPKEADVYFRLNSIFMKNKYGYNTRFMSDFDLLLELLDILLDDFLSDVLLHELCFVFRAL